MKLFVIHRFKDRKHAKRKLKKLTQDLSLELQPIFLNSFGGEEWKQKAENALRQAEAVIVFNPTSCKESKNAKWEIEKAKESEKEIIELNKDSNDVVSIAKLMSLYELNDEFESCFSSGNKDILELYKLMIDSSESLIQRRDRKSVV